MPILVERSTHIRVSPERLWALLADPTLWSQWDPSLLKLELAGPVAPQQSGILQSANGMKLPLQLLRVEPLHLLEYQVRLPGIRVTFERRLTSQLDNTCGLTQRVRSGGLLAWLLYPTQRRVFTREAERSLESLKQKAETD